MVANLSTLTERGQVSVPAALRRQLGITPGQSLIWSAISEDEFRVRVVRRPRKKQSPSMRGFIKTLQKKGPATTAEWMELLREGEKL